MGRMMRSLPAALGALIALVVLSTCSNGVDFRAEVVDEVMKANDLYLEITDVTPDNQDQGVNTFQTMLIVFDRDIDQDTISASTITILNEDTQLPVSWTHVYSPATRLLSLNSALEGPIWYTVTVSDGVKGLDGSSLREPYAWTFETQLGLGGSLAISNGAVYTTSTTVAMNITLNSIAEGYRVSTLADPTSYWAANPSSDWVNTPGPLSTTHPTPPALPAGDGEKKVYIQFRESTNVTPALAMFDTIMLDTTAPGAPVVTGTTPTTSRKPTWSWTSGGGGNGTYRYNIDAGGWTETTTASYTPPSDLALGDHTVNVQERDEAGNWSVSGTKVIGIKPLAPTNVAATDSTITTHVAIGWTAATGATAYYVDRSTSATGTYSNVGNTASTSYNDGTATAGTIYYYKIRSFAASYYSDLSAYDAGSRKLSAPTGVTATDNTNSAAVAVSWTAPAGTVSSYYVDRSTTSTGTYSNIGTSATTSFNDTSATPAVVYYYKVRAYSGGYYSDASGYDSGVRQLATPTGVAATDGTVTTGITVSWSAVSSAASYTVYRSADNVTFGAVITGVATTSWTDTAPADSVSYYYKVAAVANGYYSAQSTSNVGYRGLDAPTGVIATDGTGTGSGGNVYITWSAVTGAEGYIVYRSTTYNGTYSSIGSTASLYFTDSSATYLTTYYYKLRAYGNTTAFPGLWSSYNSGWRWNMLGDLTGVWYFDATWLDYSYVNSLWDDFVVAAGDPILSAAHVVGSQSADLDGNDLLRSSGSTFMSADRKSVTVAFWVAPRVSVSSITYIMMCSDFGISQSSTNRINFSISVPSTNSAYTTVTVNAWTHIVGTYDGTTIRLYKNGTLVHSVAHAGTVSNSGRQLEVGGWTSGVWNGYIDDLRIYRRVLTAPEIQGLYAWR